MTNLERRVSQLEDEVDELKRLLIKQSKVSLRRDAKNSLYMRKMGRHFDDYKRTSGWKRR